ncbi:EF-hand domain-containing protein [Caulobacter sp. CCNWLY153]|uniref:EF-hand domain-containing protein n=1 Tax=unclassified Caulobacter TaxID=2648921 RepID=UPI002FF40775
MIRNTLILAAVLAAVSAPALAASHARDTFIKEQDVNGDGIVTKEEFVITRDQLFKAIDADKNGVLSKEEYVGEFKVRLEKRLAASTEAAEKKEEERVRQMRQADVRFGVLDSDKSGGITPAEFAYSGWRMFVTHDTNKDGVVSAADPVAADTN